jgi:hypothetical protein
MKAYLAHAIGMALLGVLLPSGDHLGFVHRLVTPLVEAIPNAQRVTLLAPDPIFAQTYIGLSLVFALAILLFFIVKMRGYRTKTFDSARQRRGALASMWAIVAMSLGLFWFVPYLDPASKGRLYFLIHAATSSEFGVLFVMNLLIVGFVLLPLLGLWAGHACTSVRARR